MPTGDPAAAVPPSVMKVSFNINGQAHALDLDTRATLLDALREHLHLFGTKKGCDQGQCGACTIIAGGTADQLLPDLKLAPQRRHRPL